MTTQELTIDEVTLAMKSTLTGLCKVRACAAQQPDSATATAVGQLSGEHVPSEEELEMKTLHAFEAVLGATTQSKAYIGKVARRERDSAIG
jgi:hypothetical protein